MMLIEDNTVPDAALPMEAFRAHLRLGTGFGVDTLQDDVLAGFLRASLASIENRTGKILLQRGFTLRLNAWRDPAGQPLPVAPVFGIDSVTLMPAVGAGTAVDPAAYRLEQDAQCPVLRPAGMVLPEIPNGGAVQIAMTAGFAPDWAGLPADLRQAAMLLGAHFYEYRNETTLSTGCAPFGVTSLIERYRPIRLFAGRAR
ncbi:MAG: hypothetical protein NXH82_08110 [Rhodobacteraceae bacterium]|nr:hypothetical protein [Paracoccaceae bacterium]